MEGSVPASPLDEKLKDTAVVYVLPAKEAKRPSGTPPVSAGLLVTEMSMLTLFAAFANKVEGMEPESVEFLMVS